MNKKIMLVILVLLSVLIWYGPERAFYEIMRIARYKKKDSDNDRLIQFHAANYGVDPDLIRAIIMQESGYDADVMGFDGLSIGLMQITKPVAHDYFYPGKPYDRNNPDVEFSQFVDPDINIQMGTQLIARLIKKYSGDLNKALDAYNMGSGNVDKGKDIAYSDEVLNYYNQYRGIA